MPPASVSLTDWGFDPSIYAGIAVVCALYWRAHRRGWLRSTDDLTPWGLSPRSRSAFFAGGVLICFVALESPIDYIGDNYLNAVHMLQHMLLMVVAPPLIILGVAGAAPPSYRPLRGPWRLWTGITSPWRATPLFTLTMWIWHYPSFYDAALENNTLHAFEHLTFLAAGLIFWWHVVEPIRGNGIKPISTWTKFVTMTLVGVPCTVLAFIFILAAHPFYSFFVEAPRLWGISALSDQQLAGVAMLVMVHLAMFGGITPIFLRMFASGGQEDEWVDAQVLVPAPAHASAAAGSGVRLSSDTPSSRQPVIALQEEPQHVARVGSPATRFSDHLSTAGGRTVLANLHEAAED